MTPLAILRKARKLLTNPLHWGQGKYFAGSGDTACMCLMGAVHVAAGLRDERSGLKMRSDDPAEINTARHLLSKVIRCQSIESWNDHPGRRHVTVLLKLDRAIVLAEAE